MRVSDIMTQPVVTVTEQTTLEEVAQTMLSQRIGGVPVINQQGHLTGIITESDFAAKEKGMPFSTFRAPQVLGQWLTPNGFARICAAAKQMQAREIMRHPVVTIREDQTVEDALQLLLRHNINRLPVVRQGIPVGILARHDLLRLMASQSVA